MKVLIRFVAILTTTVVGLLATPATVIAHHSMAEFKRSNIHELQGVVTKVSWRNPHVELELQVTDADGNKVIWEIEAQGYSVGRWEEDVLVVSTSRVNWPYFDDMAKIPQSESVQMVERFELNEDGTQMDYELTVTDPSSFSEPVLGRWLMDWRPDMEMQQYDCIPPEYKE